MLCEHSRSSGKQACGNDRRHHWHRPCHRRGLCRHGASVSANHVDDGLSRQHFNTVQDEMHDAQYASEGVVRTSVFAELTITLY